MRWEVDKEEEVEKYLLYIMLVEKSRERRGMRRERGNKSMER